MKFGGMKMKKRILFVLFVFSVLSSQVLALGSGEENYEHPYPQDVMVGDILVGHSPSSDWLIPGYWTHSSMVAYYDDGEWMVVEAWFSGVRVIRLSEYMERYDDVALLRVRTTNSVRNKAVNFALSQLGKPYDYRLWTKQAYGRSYYCSELVWAAYLIAGVDVDRHPGFSWKYLWGVAPQEIYDDGDTYVIYQDHS